MMDQNDWIIYGRQVERQEIIAELEGYSNTELLTADKSYNKGHRQGIFTALGIIKKRGKAKKYRVPSEVGA